VQRESGYRPAARNGPYWGLMQILPQTARSMGFRGEPAELLDPEVNLRYAGRYLRGAWLVSGGDMDRAVQWYARGYYYEARDRCLLVATGLAQREVNRRCA
jgi:soluble lytic murein transglycosylase-like protein